MRERLKGAASGVRRKAFTPVLAKLDALSEHLDALDARLDLVFERLDQVERISQASGSRVSTLGERYQGVTESAARVASRVEELERLMGAVQGR